MDDSDAVITQRSPNLSVVFAIGNAPMPLATHDVFFQIEIMNAQPGIEKHSDSPPKWYIFFMC